MLFPVFLFSQKENWDTYMASYEKGPGSTLLDMSLKNIAPIRVLPFVLVTGVTFEKCTPEGFPQDDQFSDLYLVSDSVETSLSKTVGAKLVGTFTYQCQRLDYYYLSDTNAIRNSLVELYQKSFPHYTYYINIKADSAWTYYLDFLYPNEQIMEYMSNQKVVLQLLKQGDKLLKPRQVDHWLYFMSEKGRDNFITYAKDQNFKIEAKETIKDSELPYQLHISRTDKVDLSSITQLTLELRKMARKFNGDYDGWETFLVKD
ncbi:MAG TPA: DUF695 domain-containing protein [Chitinophagaceae bacterium]|jgi:hypothetical protein|nr:DUF695 domain-containing protein [Chitinophagaceae bacterium]